MVRRYLWPPMAPRTVTLHIDPTGNRHSVPEVPHACRFDLGHLALYLAQPALHGEFRPASPWAGWTLERERAAPVSTDRSQLRPIFDQTVADLIDGHDVVAVRLSGGMDSAAVLCALMRTASPGVKVVAIVTEAVTDSGATVSEQATRIARTICPNIDRIRVEVLSRSATSAPPWSSVGPCLEAAPGKNAEAVEAARAAGATIMLSGDGADELLTVPAFLGAAIHRSGGARSAVRYLRDHHPTDVLVTVIAMLSSLLPSRRPESAARAYQALTSTPGTPGIHVLEPLYARTAADWGRRYDDAMLDLTTDLIGDGGWARAEAHLAVWPQEALHVGAAIPIRSPFLEAPFVNHALGLALTERWDPTARTPYLRRKAAVASLVDLAVTEILPDQKEGFAADLSSTVETDRDTPTLVGLGLVRAHQTVTDTATLLTLRALEEWVNGALERGYEPERS